MAECIFRSGVYDGWVFDSGLFPVVVYSFYSGDEDIVFGELSERAGGIVFFWMTLNLYMIQGFKVALII